MYPQLVAEALVSSCLLEPDLDAMMHRFKDSVQPSKIRYIRTLLLHPSHPFSHHFVLYPLVMLHITVKCANTKITS